MKTVLIIASVLLLTACTTVQNTPLGFCSSPGPVSIINKQPDTEYITCGNIQIDGPVVSNLSELNALLLEEGRKLNADAVIPLQKIDEFNWAEARVRRVHAIAIQFK